MNSNQYKCNEYSLILILTRVKSLFLISEEFLVSRFIHVISKEISTLKNVIHIICNIR